MILLRGQLSRFVCRDCTIFFVFVFLHNHTIEGSSVHQSTSVLVVFWDICSRLSCALVSCQMRAVNSQTRHNDLHFNRYRYRPASWLICQGVTAFPVQWLGFGALTAASWFRFPVWEHLSFNMSFLFACCLSLLCEKGCEDLPWTFIQRSEFKYLVGERAKLNWQSRSHGRKVCIGGGK